MKDLVELLIQIFKQDDKLIKDFAESMLEGENTEMILELMLDCPDNVARTWTAKLFKYLVCRLKKIEKADLASHREIEI